MSPHSLRMLRWQESFGPGIFRYRMITQDAERLDFSTPPEAGKKLTGSLNAAKWTRRVPLRPEGAFPDPGPVKKTGVKMQASPPVR